MGCFQLTTQPSSGIAPVGAYTLGPAECCIGLQALTECVSNIAIAVVTDTGSEESIWRDEPVALSKDPMTVSEWSGLGQAQQGGWPRELLPKPTTPKGQLTGSASAHREVQWDMGWRSVCWTLWAGEWCWGEG